MARPRKPDTVCGMDRQYHRGCRCDKCKQAHSEYNRILAEMKSRHGTNSRYMRGCRCTECKEAHAGVNRRIRAMRKPPKGENDSQVIRMMVIADKLYRMRVAKTRRFA